MKNLLFRRYQKAMNRPYDLGGTVPYTQFGQLGAGIIDTFDKPDQYGGRSLAGSMGSKALSMAGTGAAIGSAVPGVGTAIGAGVGAIAGLATGFFGGKANNEKAKSLRNTMGYNQLQKANNFSAAQLAADPSLATGTNEQSYFAKGGPIGMRKYVKAEYGGQVGTDKRSPLNDYITEGGTAKRLSSDNAIIKGQSHSEGGVVMNGLDTEVEGGESTKDNFVFSKKLGFAALHIPIAKAKGIIEKKPRTLERANSLRRLVQREEELAQQQEQYKAQNGLS